MAKSQRLFCLNQPLLAMATFYSPLSLLKATWNRRSLTSTVNPLTLEGGREQPYATLFDAVRFGGAEAVALRHRILDRPFEIRQQVRPKPSFSIKCLPTQIHPKSKVGYCHEYFTTNKRSRSILPIYKHGQQSFFWRTFPPSFVVFVLPQPSFE